MADFNIKQVIAAVSGVLSAYGPAVLQNINGENWEGAVAYFQIFNSSSAPLSGAVPLFSWRIPAEGGFNCELPGPTAQALIGETFANGISVGWSTTDETFTAAATGGKWWATGENNAP